MTKLPLIESNRQKNVIVLKSSTQKLKNYTYFNYWFFIFIFIPLLGVALFNYIIDPYDIFNRPYFGKINHNKIEKDNNDRLFKAIDIIRIKPITVLLGSSRIKQGINTHHSVLKNQPVYNLGLNGANLYENLRYLEHTIKNQPNLKEVIIGVDFFMFNEYRKPIASFSENRLEKHNITLQDEINSLLSLDTLLKSRETMIASLNESEINSNYGRNGFQPHTHINDGNTIGRFHQSILQYFTLNPKYKLSREYLEDFKSLVKVCQKHNIDLKVFISPSHATDGEVFRETGQWQSFEKWKRELVKITPVWDFSCYNSITTEKIQAKMKNYADNSHYNKQVGNLILNRIFNQNNSQIPQDFGVLITAENIEKHLQKIRSDREIWIQKNSQEVELVRNLKKKFDKNQK